jgi:c-di-GMP-related signal transduction protein
MTNSFWSCIKQLAISLEVSYKLNNVINKHYLMKEIFRIVEDKWEICFHLAHYVRQVIPGTNRNLQSLWSVI